MNQPNTPPLDEATLHALVDGRLVPTERTAAQARLDKDPEALRTVQAWQAQRDLLRSLHQDVAREAVPPQLAEAARQVGRAGASLRRWQRWGGMAASVLVAFTVGWLAHGQWDLRPGSGTLAKARSADFG